jgi:hypothetical protein
MKKFLMMMAVMMVCSILFFCEGCQTAKSTSLIGTVKQVIIGDDYEAAGKVVGEAGYMAYVILKGNPKYEKYVQKCEELYSALNNAESETVKLGTINTVAMEIMNVALTAKYGYVKAQLITTGVRIGGAVADRIIAKRVDTIAADKFVKGFKEGLDLAIAKTPADALIPAEKEQKIKVFDCPDGNCTFTSGSRDVKFQQRLAQQLIDDGYVDKNEAVKEGHNAYQNCKDLITRCKTLRKFNVEETRCYIHHFTIEGGKLKEIEFHMIGYTNGDEPYEYVTNCVTCEMYIELDNLPDDVEF